MAIGRHLLRAWPMAAWYAGRFGDTVSVDGCRVTMPSRHLAGLVRLGGYEVAERQAVRRFLPRDLPLVELGCGTGLVACLANTRLHNGARHICVDGNPRALAATIANGRANGLLFHTLHAAVAYDTASVTFGMDAGIVAGGIESGHEAVTVPTTTLESVMASMHFGHASLICDIEGAEQQLIAREGDLLAARVPVLILETHPKAYGLAAEHAIDARLTTLGFRRRWRRDDVSVWWHA